MKGEVLVLKMLIIVESGFNNKNYNHTKKIKINLLKINKLLDNVYVLIMLPKANFV